MLAMAVPPSAENRSITLDRPLPGEPALEITLTSADLSASAWAMPTAWAASMLRMPSR